MVVNFLNLERLYVRLTYDFWRRVLPRFGISQKGAKVLECGTGPGHLLGLLTGWFPEARLFGLDIDLKAVVLARRNSHGCHLLTASAESLPFPEESFNVLISFHMIEHLARPEHFISEVFRVLRSGGVLALATPNPTGIGARLMGKRWSSWCSEHISLKSPEQWREVLSASGFNILREGTTGLSGIPVFRKFPLGWLNRGTLLVCGFFPWRHGEAFICIAQKRGFSMTTPPTL